MARESSVTFIIVASVGRSFGYTVFIYLKKTYLCTAVVHLQSFTTSSVNQLSYGGEGRGPSFSSVAVTSSKRDCSANICVVGGYIVMRMTLIAPGGES